MHVPRVRAFWSIGWPDGILLGSRNCLPPFSWKPATRSSPSHVFTTLSPTLGTPLTPEQCQVASGHIPCIVRRTSKEACQQAGCCYDNTREVPCFYGNTGTTFHTKHGPSL